MLIEEEVKGVRNELITAMIRTTVLLAGASGFFSGLDWLVSQLTVPSFILTIIEQFTILCHRARASFTLKYRLAMVRGGVLKSGYRTILKIA